MEDADENLKIIGEFERKMKDDRTLIRKTSIAQRFGWVLMAVGGGMIILLPGLWWTLGLLVSVVSALCVYTAIKLKGKTEKNLREYQNQKADLVDHFMKRRDLWD